MYSLYANFACYAYYYAIIRSNFIGSTESECRIFSYSHKRRKWLKLLINIYLIKNELKPSTKYNNYYTYNIQTTAILLLWPRLPSTLPHQNLGRLWILCKKSSSYWAPLLQVKNLQLSKAIPRNWYTTWLAGYEFIIHVG